jgi:CelD/BcsL family acetyltransferase involved in cellulose biosynthesis
VLDEPRAPTGTTEGGPPSPGGEPTVFRLKYWLGPLVLGAAAFRVARIDCEHAGCTEAALLSHFAAATADGRDGVLARTLPVPVRQARLRIDGGRIHYLCKRFNHSVIDLSGSYDGYLAKFSAKTRSTFRRKQSKFAALADGKLDMRVYRTAAEMEQFYPLARAISAETYQERRFNAGLPVDDGFLRDMRQRAQDGTVRGFLLFVGGRAVSYLYCPIRDQRVVYGYLGFLPEFRAHSPGTVLQLLALRSLYDEGKHRLFDFTEGDGEHKAMFATQSTPSAHMLILAANRRNHTLLELHRRLDRLDERTRALNQALGLQQRLRRLFRA